MIFVQAPLEATPEMAENARTSELRTGGLAYFYDIWAAMIAARPAPLSPPLTHGEFAQIVATAFLQGIQFSMQQPDEKAIKARGANTVVTDAAKDYATRVLRVWKPKLRKDDQ